MAYDVITSSSAMIDVFIASKIDEIRVEKRKESRYQICGF